MKNLTHMMLAITLATGALAHSQGPTNSVVSVPGVSLQVNTAPKDDLFAGTEKFAKGASKSEEIDLDPNSMGLVGNDSNAKPNNRELASKMRRMSIREYTYDKPGMYSMQDVVVYMKKLDDGTWSCSVRVRSNTEDTAICGRPATGSNAGETVIITAKPTKLTFIHMTGNVQLKNLLDKDVAPAVGAPQPK